METERIKMRGIQWAHLLGYLLCVFYVYVWFFRPLVDDPGSVLRRLLGRILPPPPPPQLRAPEQSPKCHTLSTSSLRIFNLLRNT